MRIGGALLLPGAVGFDNVSVACYPSGSGNDFVKVFGSKNDFLNINDLINGKVTKVDVIKVNEKYALNICNFGFDGAVVDKMLLFKNKPFVSGKGAYYLAVLYSILSKMNYQCEIKIDGEHFYQGNFLLCALANGICYGGGFYCAPKAIVNDGMIDVVLVKKVRRLKFVSLMGVYRKGKHLEDKRLVNIVKYAQGKTIEVTSPKDLVYTLDGETGKTQKLCISIIEKGINFVIPQKLVKE